MSGAMNRHLCSRINYVNPDRELLCKCPGIIKTMHTGFSAYTYFALCQRPGADTEKLIFLQRGKICVVFWMLSSK